MTLTQRFFTFFAAIIFSNFVFAQKAEDFKTKIDRLITQTDPLPFNGVILITKNKKILYQKAYGVTDFESKNPLKIDNRFEIMSNTKQMTSVLLLKEVENGKINLQSPIKKYLPNLTQLWADSVTVHQLLNHTHGIINIDKPLIFKHVTKFKYGNLSNVLLGQIIENVSHKTYRENMTQLFKSLGMKNSSLFIQGNNPKLVKGYINNQNSFEVPTKPFITEENLAADGVVTTVADLAIWNTKLHNGKILKTNSYKLMTTPSTLSQHNVFGKEAQGYGYNIRIVTENGINYIGHTGLGDGFSSLNVYIPKNKINIIIFENQMNENPELYYYYETLIKNIILESNLVN